MKTITTKDGMIFTKGGQIFEILESRKEALHYLEGITCDPFDFSEMSEDDTLYIRYKDGSQFFAGWNGGEIEGKFKKTGIETIIYSNACTTALYGDYRIYNMDDTNEEYSEENDSEEKFWNADVR